MSEGESVIRIGCLSGRQCTKLSHSPAAVRHGTKSGAGHVMINTILVLYRA